MAEATSKPMKPIPLPNEDTESFWDGCREHRLLFQRCRRCGAVRFYPRILCLACSSTDAEWIEASGRGRVYSHSTVHRAPTPAFRADVPYVLAIVELEEGVRMMTNIVGCSPDEVHIDMPVRVEFEPLTDAITLPKFTPLR